MLLGSLQRARPGNRANRLESAVFELPLQQLDVQLHIVHHQNERHFSASSDGPERVLRGLAAKQDTR